MAVLKWLNIVSLKSVIDGIPLADSEFFDKLFLLHGEVLSKYGQLLATDPACLLSKVDALV